jgi:hypothetical protein
VVKQPTADPQHSLVRHRSSSHSTTASTAMASAKPDYKARAHRARGSSHQTLDGLTYRRKFCVTVFPNSLSVLRASSILSTESSSAAWRSLILSSSTMRTLDCHCKCDSRWTSVEACGLRGNGMYLSDSCLAPICSPAPTERTECVGNARLHQTFPPCTRSSELGAVSNGEKNGSS